MFVCKVYIMVNFYKLSNRENDIRKDHPPPMCVNKKPFMWLDFECPVLDYVYGFTKLYKSNNRSIMGFTVGTPCKNRSSCILNTDQTSTDRRDTKCIIYKLFMNDQVSYTIPLYCTYVYWLLRFTSGSRIIHVYKTFHDASLLPKCLDLLFPEGTRFSRVLFVVREDIFLWTVLVHSSRDRFLPFPPLLQVSLLEVMREISNFVSSIRVDTFFFLLRPMSRFWVVAITRSLSYMSFDPYFPSCLRRKHRR